MTTTITARRPNGQLEIVDVSDKYPVGINDKLFARMQVATREAGRGELLSYNCEDCDERTAAEVAWDAVERIYDQATAAADYPAKSIMLAKQADDLAAQWHADYPAESAARAAEEQERRREIANGPIARAMAEGRD